MAKASRDKGARGELAFAKAIGGIKMPLSGAIKGFEGDVQALNLRWQVKTRKGGFKLLYDYMKGHDALAVKQDFHDWLVIMPVETLLSLLDS